MVLVTIGYWPGIVCHANISFKRLKLMSEKAFKPSFINIQIEILQHFSQFTRLVVNKVLIVQYSTVTNGGYPVEHFLSPCNDLQRNKFIPV